MNAIERVRDVLIEWNRKVERCSECSCVTDRERSPVPISDELCEFLMGRLSVGELLSTAAGEAVDLRHTGPTGMGVRLRRGLIWTIQESRGLRWHDDFAGATWQDLEAIDHRVLLRQKNFGVVSLREFERVLAERKERTDERG